MSCVEVAGGAHSCCLQGDYYFRKAGIGSYNSGVGSSTCEIIMPFLIFRGIFQNL